MAEMRHQYLMVNDREIHVREWNPKGKETVFCSHGLAQNSIDFFELGHSMALKGYHVIAPDTLGRGLSEWATDPKKEYSYSQYVNTSVKLLDFYSCERAHWIGTSMGGLVGLLMASDPLYSTRLGSLTLNDIGPEVPDSAINRIFNYVKSPIEFNRYSEINQYLKILLQSFGPHTAQQWERTLMASVRRLDSGKFTTHYDPNILAGYSPDGIKINLWHHFSRIQIPLLLMNGLHSDVLTKDIVKRMRLLQPNMSVNYYLSCGHSPNLSYKSHRDDVECFIEKNPIQNEQAEQRKAN